MTDNEVEDRYYTKAHGTLSINSDLVLYGDHESVSKLASIRRNSSLPLLGAVPIDIEELPLCSAHGKQLRLGDFSSVNGGYTSDLFPSIDLGCVYTGKLHILERSARDHQGYLWYAWLDVGMNCFEDDSPVSFGDAPWPDPGKLANLPQNKVIVSHASPWGSPCSQCAGHWELCRCVTGGAFIVPATVVARLSKLFYETLDDCMASCSDTYYGCAGCMSEENVLSRVITARPELFHFIGHRAEYGWCRVATDLKKTSGAVLYAIKTAYKERLDAQMSTWASEVDHESLFIVGDWNSTSPNVLDAVGCSHDYHEGTLCKMGRLLSRVRHKMTGRPAITTRWVFIVDDDAYVDTANLEMALGQFDSERPIALGALGCGSPLGFCGGGGIAISRAALGLFGNLSDSALEDRFKSIRSSKVPQLPRIALNDTTPLDDTTLSVLLSEFNVEILDVPGLYFWALGDIWASDAQVRAHEAMYRAAIESRKPRPLTFHYIRDLDQMGLIHKWTLTSRTTSHAASENHPDDYAFEVAKADVLSHWQG